MALEHGRLLELAADSNLGNVSLILLGEIYSTLKKHLTLIRFCLAGNDVHHRCLAGAIRTNNGTQLARLDDEGQRIKRLEPIEGNGNTVEIKQSVGAFGHYLSYSAGVACKLACTVVSFPTDAFAD
ncbi:hypothetical protein D9M69_629020 [compost metagenome]